MAIQIKKIESRALALRGNDIDTDRIIPARFLKCITFDGLGDHAFEDDRLGEKGNNRVHPFDNPSFKGAGILVVNKNFGCGSSREHAPQSLQRWGIKAIVGESFAGIFFGNCVTLGIPCLTLSAEEIGKLQGLAEQKPETLFKLDIENQKIEAGEFKFKPGVSSNVKEQFVLGYWDVTGLLLDNLESIKEKAKSLPYMKW